MVCSSWSEIFDLRLAPCPNEVLTVVFLRLVLACLWSTLIKIFLSFEKVDLVQECGHLFRSVTRSPWFHVWYHCLDCDFPVIHISWFGFCTTLSSLCKLHIYLLRLCGYILVLYWLWGNRIFVPCHGIHTLIIWRFHDISIKPVFQWFHVLLLD